MSSPSSGLIELHSSRRNIYAQVVRLALHYVGATSSVMQTLQTWMNMRMHAYKRICMCIYIHTYRTYVHSNVYTYVLRAKLLNVREERLRVHAIASGRPQEERATPHRTENNRTICKMSPMAFPLHELAVNVFHMPTSIMCQDDKWQPDFENGHFGLIDDMQTPAPLEIAPGCLALRFHRLRARERRVHAWAAAFRTLQGNLLGNRNSPNWRFVC